MASPRPRRRYLSLILWNLAVLVGLLVILELIFGSWLSERNLGRLAVKRDIHYVHDVNALYPSSEPITFIRDQYGLRGAYGTPENVTILAVGGSTTNERWVSEEKTWTRLLEAKLAASGSAHTIANAGHDGHSTVAHIKSFEEWFPKIPGLAPDFVIVYAGINDVGVAPGTLRREDSLTYSDPARRVRKYITNNSALITLLKTIRGYVTARQIRVAHEEGLDWNAMTWTERPPEVARSEDLDERIGDFRDRLDLLDRLIKEFGAKPIYVTQTRCGTRLVDGKRLLVSDAGEVASHAELMAFGEETLRFCAASGAICVPLHREFAFGPGDCYDYVHTTDGGASTLADYLFSKLGPVL